MTGAPGASLGRSPGQPALGDLLEQARDEVVDIERAELVAVLVLQRHRAGLHLLAADHREIGDAVVARGADLGPELVGAGIGRGADAGLAQARHHLVRIGRLLVGDGQHADLLGREPERELAGEVLDQDADEALHRAEDGSVEHHRVVLVAVLADVGGVEARLGRQLVVDLDGAALPMAAEGVDQGELQLRAVERALALGHRVGQPGLGAGVAERGLGAVPGRIIADALGRAVGELDDDAVLAEAEVGIDLLEQGAERGHLAGDLRLAAEDVGVVLDEAAHAHDAVQRARDLIARARAELGHAQRQVAVGLEALAEDLDVTRAVHRLEREGALLRFGDEHVLLVLVPVPGALPQRARHHARGLDLDVAVAADAGADVLLEHAVDRPALGMPVDLAGVLLVDVEEIHLLAQLAVVALLRLLDAQEVGLEALVVREAGAVDAGEAVAQLVAMPVGARHRHDLEGAEHAGRRHVRTGAEILPGLPAAERGVAGDAGGVEGDGGRALGDGAFGVVMLVLVGGGARQALGAADVGAHERAVGGDDPAHGGLDGGEVGIGQGARLARAVDDRHVIEEAVLDRRPVGETGLGIERANGLGEDVRAAVAQDLERIGIVVGGGDDGDRGVLGQGPVEIADLAAVELDRDGLAGQAGADGGGDVAAAGGLVEGQRFAVGQGERGIGGQGGGVGCGMGPRRGPAQRDSARSSRPDQRRQGPARRPRDQCSVQGAHGGQTVAPAPVGSIAAPAPCRGGAGGRGRRRSPASEFHGSAATPPPRARQLPAAGQRQREPDGERDRSHHPSASITSSSTSAWNTSPASS